MKTFKLLTLLSFCLSFATCQTHSFSPEEEEYYRGYERTKSGLYYKFHVKTEREKTREGDWIFGQFWQYWCDSLIFVSDTFTVIGPIDEPLFKGDIPEGFLMMRVNDSASFILNADSVIKHWGLRKDPNLHLCECFKMTVHLKAIEPYIADSAEILKKIALDSIKQARKSVEQARLQTYLHEKNITATPNSDGIYVMVLKKGNGSKLRKGKTAVFDYIGYLLDGTIWDASNEEIAYEAGIVFPQRIYKPRELKLGEKQWLKGLDDVLIGQRTGSKLRIILPSDMAFGHEGNAFVDEFQTIVLEVDLMEN